MLKLEPVADDALGAYDAIVGGKRPMERRKRLKELRPQLEKAYAQYEMHKPDLERLTPGSFTEREKADLRKCYTGRCRARDELYARIKELSLWCAYCTARTVSTLDHYLPKEPYPEYSVLPVNLVPSCDKCNEPRDFRDSTGRRALLHPYFDPIPPQDRLLIAVVTIEKGLPRATFWVDTSSGSAFSELYARHFELLSLSEGYAMPASDVLAGAVEAARAWPAYTREDVRQLLDSLAAAEERLRKVNAFKATLLRGASASDEFLDYCLRGTA